MRRADWTDEDGRKHAVFLPDDADNTEADTGIPIGPLPLGSLGLPLSIEVHLHNELHARGVLTADDLRRRRAEAVNAIAAALKLDVIALEQAWAAGNFPAPVDDREAPHGIEDDLERVLAEEAAPARNGATRARAKAPARTKAPARR